jgi:predicted dehydrogenase
MSDTLRLGVLGCGVISDTYLTRAGEFEGLEVVACADIDQKRAQAQASRYSVKALDPEALIASPDIDLVINLTPPTAHAAIGRAVLAAGKHLYAEKPLGVTLEEGRELVAAAAAAGRRIGCAPDTFLGGGHQNARRLVDQGAIGRPVAGTIAFMNHGMEDWHPNPTFFYQPGGGPVLDIGPYYVTALVNLIGPVRRVCAFAARAFEERIVTAEPRYVERVPVEVQTHVAGTLEFACGAIVTVTVTWDVWAERPYQLNLYGTEGSLLLPDPNFFGGATAISRKGSPFEPVEPQGLAYAKANRPTRRGTEVADYRIIGVVDMARAIQEGRPHRCSGELALHVLEVLTALERSAQEGAAVPIETPCSRPEALTAAF